MRFSLTIVLIIANVVAAGLVFAPQNLEQQINSLAVGTPVPRIKILGRLPGQNIVVTVECITPAGPCDYLRTTMQKVVTRWMQALNAFGRQYGIANVANVVISLGSGGQIRVRYGSCVPGAGAQYQAGVVTACGAGDEVTLVHEFGHALGVEHMLVMSPDVPYEIMAQTIVSKSRITTLDCYAIATGKETLPASIPYTYMETEWGGVVPEFPYPALIMPILFTLSIVILRRHRTCVKTASLRTGDPTCLFLGGNRNG